MKEIVLENGNTLAFIGDAIYGLLVKEYFVRQGYHKPNVLQQKSVPYLSASGQAKIVQSLIEKSVFTEVEYEIFLRGRNAKSESIAKNADVIDYRLATGLEAVFGYLYLYKYENRIVELLDLILKGA